MKADQDERQQEHQKVWEFLPAIANGNADAEQARFVQHHLPGCAECRAELVREQRMRAALTLPGQHMPDIDRGFRRLSRRLDEADGRDDASAWRRRFMPRFLGAGLVGVGLFEAAAFAALLVVGARLHAPAAPVAAYRTLSSDADRPAHGSASLRLVFDGARPVRELQALLQARGLVVVDGPSEAGVWSVGFAQGAGDAERVAKNLRQVPGVLFAEPLGLPES